ncbi:hypothetical protein BS47DRAFT_1297301 [Hydnum rufescens UP504]|uniref:Copper transport protein n=1 Tax=Hydnum rufescens UP504 TaxID=1448309 RepID=A0A9P6DVJ5_9AGAM|nr:hypothetical protein BS47DRAFT_1297301 [Hydnum rufescens UP504]
MVIFNLHFSSGDPIWFAMWQPTSHRAVVGACSGLVLLAIFEKLVSCMRSVLEVEWKRWCWPPPSPASNEKPNAASSISSGASRTFTRTIPPFIISHDIPRGVLFMGHALLRYMLMLAVMTYSASYIISILIGLSIGEVAYGRLAYESVVEF